jgi:UDP-2,3-diacylglucosamine hydrolase
MNDKVYFVSDIHLGIKSQAQPKYDFYEFLQFIEKDASRLFIVGDMFEFWFEYKYLIPNDNVKILAQLLALTKKGVQIDYLVGNHDFALGKFLSEQIGMTIHWKPLQINLGGLRFHIMHGDGLYKRDFGYRLIKPVLRSRFNQFLYRLLPADFSMSFAHFCATLSRYNPKNEKQEKVRDNYRSIANQLLSQGNDVVVLAHTHIPDQMKLENGMYVNIGAWFRQCSYAVFENGNIQLKYFGQD